MGGRQARGTGRRAEQGFTLLEVIVAFMIAAGALAVLVRSTTGAIQMTRVAGQYDEAVARADSHLAALSAAPLVESDRQGDEGGGFHWHARIVSAGSVHSAAMFTEMAGKQVTLFRVTVTMSWSANGTARAVRLESSMLGPVS